VRGEGAYVRGPAVIWRSTSTRVVACVPGHAPAELEGGAALLWRVLGEPATIDELAEDVHQAFGLGLEEARRTVAATVEGLLAAGLLVRA
jgi:hypothetical protein